MCASEVVMNGGTSVAVLNEPMTSLAKLAIGVSWVRLLEAVNGAITATK